MKKSKHDLIFKKVHLNLFMTSGISISLLFAVFFLIFNLYMIGSNYADADRFFDSIAPETFFSEYLEDDLESNLSLNDSEKKEDFFKEKNSENEDPENKDISELQKEKKIHLVKNYRPYEYREHFVASLDHEGNILLVFHDFSNRLSFTHESLSKFIKDMMKEGRIQNYNFDGFAYRFSQHGTGFSVMIIDRKSEIAKEKNYFYLSILIFILSSFAGFILSWKFTWGALATAEESYSSQKRFIADASHELKTPISVIGANIDVLEEEIPGNKWLEYIKTENNRMSILVKDLLYLAKNDAGQVEYTILPFDIVNACTCSVLAFESIAFEENKRLELEISEKEIIVNGDEAKIRQIIIILTDNAIKNSDKNALIKVSCYTKGEYVCVRVWNSGYGIPEKDIPNIFDRFFRSDLSRSRVTGGSGLGLPIALSIAERHGGTITVESKENEYALFVLKIPLQKNV